VNVSVLATAWMSVGQFIFTEVGGSYSVNAINSAISVSLKNLGYIGNAAPGVNIPSASKVSPSGHIGTAGASGSTPTLNDLSPTTTRGDVIVDNGANSPLPSDVRLAAGTNGTLFASDSAQPTGRKQVALTPNAATDNILPRFDGTGDTTPTRLQASGLLVTDDGAVQSTPTGGNARGSKAIDLQVDRSAVTQIASGANAVVAGGKDNTGSGTESVVTGGRTNLASGPNSAALSGHDNQATADNSIVAGGASNVSSGINSVIVGGSSNVASGQNSFVGAAASSTASGYKSVVVGGSNNTTSAQDSAVVAGQSNTVTKQFGFVPNGAGVVADKFGQSARNSGFFLGAGDCQASELIWRVLTTDATANVEMFLDGSSATQRATVPSNTTWAFNIIGVARRDTGVSITFEVKGGIKNDAGNTVLVAAVTATVIADGTGTALTIANFVVDADNGNDTLRIRVTGIGGQNWRWVAHARIVEVGY
jgi:hypothetical protein